MVERRSALAHLFHDADGLRRHDVPGDSALALREIRAGSLVQIGAWPDTMGEVGTVMSDLLGLDPAPLGRFSASGAALLASLAPGRWLAVTAKPAVAAKFEAALPSAQGAVTDLTHGRIVLRLEGDCAGDVLAKGCAIDFHESAFPPGRVAQTLLGHIDVTLLRRAPHVFEIVALRGFAEALAEWLLDAGLEYEIVLAPERA